MRRPQEWKRMCRTIITFALVAALLWAIPAAGAGPSVGKLARDVASALRHAKRAERLASQALQQSRASGPVGTAGQNGVSGSDGAKGAPGSDGARGGDGKAGDRGSDGAAGAKGDAGQQGTAGAPGVAVGYAHANFDSLDTERSSSNVSMHRGMNGSIVYCFDVADAEVKSAVVTLDGSMFQPNSVRAFVDVPARAACGGADVSVVLADPNIGPVSGGYWIVFN